MLCLVFAGGSIYTLPYLYQQYAGPMREVMELSRTQLGWMSTSFGVFAILCYFPGGWLADRISARALLTVSLLATGLLGLVYATFPPLPVLLAIQALWGISAILTFWGALIKATRSWGGADEQGRAFGILEGGRGVVEASLGALTAFLFGALGTAAAGLQATVIVYSGAILLTGFAVWYFVPPVKPTPPSAAGEKKGHLRQVVKMPIVWILALIILIAYGSSLGGFFTTQFARDAFGMEDDQAAWLGNLRHWLRPIAAIGAGFLAERITTRRAVGIGFTVLALSFAALAWMPTPQTYPLFWTDMVIAGGASSQMMWILWVDVAVIALAMFALRGIYFALLEEGGVPLALTGTAAGVVSVIGFTGDAFFPPLAGWIVDTYGVDAGYALIWRGLALACVVGLVATRVLRRLQDTNAKRQAN